MVFDPKTWADGELITAADLNRVEQAVDAVDEQMGSKVDATDPRLTDARPPLPHSHAVADVTGLAGRLGSLEYRSGPRDISSLAGANRAAGRIILERVSDLVILDFLDVKLSATYPSGSSGLITLPTGFRRARRIDVMIDNTQGPQRSMFLFGRADGGGGMGIWAPTTADVLRLSLVWRTTDTAPLPGTEPGIPA